MVSFLSANQRANWLLASQGLLFLAVSDLLQVGKVNLLSQVAEKLGVLSQVDVSLLLYMIAVFVILSSITTFFGILAANRSIRKLEKTWKKAKESEESSEESKDKFSIFEIQLLWLDENPVVKFFYGRGLWVPFVSLLIWAIILVWLMSFHKIGGDLWVRNVVLLIFSLIISVGMLYSWLYSCWKKLYSHWKDWKAKKQESGKTGTESQKENFLKENFLFLKEFLKENFLWVLNYVIILIFIVFLVWMMFFYGFWSLIYTYFMDMLNSPPLFNRLN